MAAALGGAGGGGGGGGSESSQPTSTSQVTFDMSFSASPNLALANSFDDAEYRQNSDLERIKPRSVWSLSAQGNDVTVHLIDSGVNASTELTDRVTYLTDHTGTGGASLDSVGHGTQMAEIIAAARNGAAAVGVAPQADLAVSKFFAASLSASSTDINAWLPSAMSQGRGQGASIVNNSWGSDALIQNYGAASLQSIYPSALSAWQSAVNAGQVIVFAAGNEGNTSGSVVVEAGLPLRFSSLERGWLAVTAVDSADQLASYANPCSSAKGWCLAAPGDARGSQGTSIATAYVSGALATLSSAFPDQPIQAIRLRLLQTADKSLDPTGDDLGQGLVDLDAALSPVGALLLQSQPLNTVNLQSGTIVQNLSGIQATARDEQGFGFQVPLDSLATAPALSLSHGGQQLALVKNAYGLQQLKGESMAQWIEPQRWGSLAPRIPLLDQVGDSWGVQYRSGPWHSWSVRDEQWDQTFAGLEYVTNSARVGMVHHHEQSSVLGVRSEQVTLGQASTLWVRGGLQLGSLKVEHWQGAGERYRLDQSLVRLENDQWELQWWQLPAVTEGSIRLLGADAQVVPEQREHRIGLARFFRPSESWYGFAKAESIHNRYHKAGRDQQFTLGVMSVF